MHVCLFVIFYHWYQEHLLLVSRAAFFFKIGIKSMFISLVSNIIFMHIYVEHSLHIFMFIVMHALRGASMKLNFNPCIYNSMSFVIIKKGEIVGPEALHSSFDDD